MAAHVASISKNVAAAAPRGVSVRKKVGHTAARGIGNQRAISALEARQRAYPTHYGSRARVFGSAHATSSAVDLAGCRVLNGDPLTWRRGILA